MTLQAVITTIQRPTLAVKELVARLERQKGSLVVIGDAKGPDAYEIPFTHFLSLDCQLALPFHLPRLLPRGHYSRKNVGYLEAIRQGATCIYETDDDNAPLPLWAPRGERVKALRVVAYPETGARRGSRWVNVYRHFTAELIWPRGLPLDEIHTPVPEAGAQGDVEGGTLRAPIQQGLVNGSPDVDAVWRLTLDRYFEFDNSASLWLAPGNWCPFNTQSTWWWPVVYPLLYIPSHCSFRMCDIWKSFVAQRCLWELGLGIVFHAPEVVQDRNAHDLMQDFSDEISGYKLNKSFVKVLEDTDLCSGKEQVLGNLFRCYEALVSHGLLPSEELALVQAWVRDVQANCPPEGSGHSESD